MSWKSFSDRLDTLGMAVEDWQQDTAMDCHSVLVHVHGTEQEILLCLCWH